MQQITDERELAGLLKARIVHGGAYMALILPDGRYALYTDDYDQGVRFEAAPCELSLGCQLRLGLITQDEYVARLAGEPRRAAALKCEQAQQAFHRARRDYDALLGSEGSASE